MDRSDAESHCDARTPQHMNSFRRFLYDTSPLWVQDAMCTAAGHLRNLQRYDRGFDERLAFYRESSRWTPGQIRDHHLERLRALFRHATASVPHYRSADYLSRGGSFPDSLPDWRTLPSLSKDDVRTAGPRLISEVANPRHLVISHSGGSTGMPLRCYHDRGSLREVYAHFWALQRNGFTREDRYATFQGLEIIPKTQTRPPWWRTNRAMRQRLYSIFHLSGGTIRSYIEDLDHYQPVYLAGYANSLYLLAKLAEEAGLRPEHSPAAVFSTSEQLYPSCRATIERVFRTRVWDAYSQDETCGSITEYECGNYHYDHAYGYMEFEDVEVLEHGRRLAEIVCTGYLNRAWPLLRYRPGDVVEYSPVESCPGCGRAGPIIHAIRGRTGDVILLPDGRHFPHISLIVKDLDRVRQTQVVQRALDHVIIRVVPAEGFQVPRDTESVRDTFARALGCGLRVEVELVGAIPRTVAGKFRSIVSEMATQTGP